MSTVSGNLEIDEKEGSVILSINPKIYPLDVVLSGAYSFTEKHYVLVDGDPKDEIIVEIRPKDKKQDIKDVGRKFNNELIIYANYAVQSLKNQRLREAIVDRVLMTNYIEPPETDFDEGLFNETTEGDAVPWEEEVKPWETSTDEQKSWFDDPEGIAIPWEEKYGDSVTKKSGKSKNKQEKK